MPKERKVRSDKKREIQPTLLIGTKNCIERLAYITDIPVKEVGEQMCIYGLRRAKIIEHLSLYFRKDIRINSTVYRANTSPPQMKKRLSKDETGRVSVRLRREIDETICAIAYSSGCTPSKSCAMLLEATVQDVDFINQFVENYLFDHIDERRMQELKEVLRYVNDNNPYDEKISMSNFISYLKDEIMPVEEVSESVSTFIIHNWRK